MTITPELDAAIRSAYRAAGGISTAHRTASTTLLCEAASIAVDAALRSLATPTPEVIEAMARAMNIDRAGNPDTERWREYVEDAESAFSAYWTHILGETK